MTEERRQGYIDLKVDVAQLKVATVYIKEGLDAVTTDLKEHRAEASKANGRIFDKLDALVERKHVRADWFNKVWVRATFMLVFVLLSVIGYLITEGVPWK